MNAPTSPNRRSSRSKTLAIIAAVFVLVGGCAALIVVAVNAHNSSISGKSSSASTIASGQNQSPPSLPAPKPQVPAAQLDIDGTYQWRELTNSCQPPWSGTVTVTHQGDKLTVAFPRVTYTGTLNADESFTTTGQLGPWVNTQRGVFASEGGGIVMRDGRWEITDGCNGTFSATKQ